ncbi:hypothetical protein PpBr36_01891 [Pyricularia pennisetigena]|uniref:hypothetical protein n=1 Tax=Pyricularia pennisetigena TaxID=1578925 RepID=UPI001150F52E|nr:hypothetical protein PpBr36_01891 [Pyricularia pennisetigena]TLS29670.1 hypothetical protein PpBr36_01891 [Pyricularia pennisetigena]
MASQQGLEVRAQANQKSSEEPLRLSELSKVQQHQQGKIDRIDDVTNGLSSLEIEKMRPTAFEDWFQRQRELTKDSDSEFSTLE